MSKKEQNVKNANDVWVLSVKENLLVDKKEKARKIYLIQVFDVKSQFVFCIQYRYLVSLGKIKFILYSVMLQYGLPKFLICNPKYRISLAFLNHDFGIQLIGQEFLSDKDKKKCVRVSHYFEKMQKKKAGRKTIQQNTRIASQYQKRWNRPDERPYSKYYEDFSQFVFLDREKLLESFLWRTRRLVKEDSTISIGANQYQIPPGYIGRQLIFRYHPLFGDKIYLYDEEKNRQLFGLLSHSESKDSNRKEQGIE